MIQGESKHQWRIRSKKETRARHSQKVKKDKEEAPLKFKAAVKAFKDNSEGEETDFFLAKVVGYDNYLIANGDKKYAVCSANVALRLNVTEIVEKNFMLDKRYRKYTCPVNPEGEYHIKFCVDMQRNVGDPGTLTEKDDVRALPAYSWLCIKPSTIAGAGHGCFAATKFEKGSFIGLYMGGKTGAPYNRILKGWRSKEPTVTCWSYTCAENFAGRSAQTMGMQMMNDPTHDVPEADKDHSLFNARINSDLFVTALREINVGEEILVDYNLTDDDSFEQPPMSPTGATNTTPSSSSSLTSKSSDKDSKDSSYTEN